MARAVIGISVGFLVIVFWSSYPHYLAEQELQKTMTVEQKCHYEYDKYPIRIVSAECYKYFK